MKAILNLRKSIIYVAAFAAMFSMASCDDDDDPQPEVLALTDANGNYEGKMNFSSTLRETQAGPEHILKAKVENINKISTDSIPLEQFILGIEGAEVTAEIMKTIKAQAYSASYSGTLNEAKDSIYMDLTAAPLEFTYTLPAGEAEEGEEATPEIKKTVKVTFATKEKANSYAKTKKLRLSLDVTKVEVKEGEGESAQYKELIGEYKKPNIEFVLDKK